MSKKSKILILLLSLTVFGLALTVAFYLRGDGGGSETGSDSSSSFPFFITWIPIFTAILAGRANKDNEEELKNDKFLKIGLLIATIALGLVVAFSFYFWL